MKKISKLLVANRGEIAIRIYRAADELKISTIGIYTYEDRYSLHKYKADEAYQVGKDDEPLKPYLDIEEIIRVAKRAGADAIHPGYGFLSENVDFASRCSEEGIIFIGPDPEVMHDLGDKITAKTVARKAGIPVIEDSELELTSVEVAISEAQRIGYPVIIKASAGGGGRGMRVVHNDDEMKISFPEARREAGRAFGIDTVFIEKFIPSPKHIEVQILADKHGNLVHLFERDCSVQRRFQKVVEVAPCASISVETKKKLYHYATAIASSVNYTHAGTVEFLVDEQQNIYFIEVNPRVQVEHTITEEITGVDIVKSQILIAQGYKLSDPEIGIKDQSSLSCNGFAIQCRVTTEDPANNFKPDYGTVVGYRNAAGFGIRLDEGNIYQGITVSPFFDSMLVKVSSWGRTLEDAAGRLSRTLREFRIRGVKTNIPFLHNVVSDPVFLQGGATVNFIEKNPHLLSITKKGDRGTKLLKYLANVNVNGNPDVKKVNSNAHFPKYTVPSFSEGKAVPKGTRDLLKELGREKFIEHLRHQKAIQYTDTTFRDAHQSLLATRVRTIDMLRVAESYAHNHPEVFSLEMWGGATFDVSMRFLHESPWQRLEELRKAIPNILFQMLIRGTNAVGYKAYPDNLIEKFIEVSAEKGIDLFRIFDSLNWIEGMTTSIKAVRERTDAIAEACICYTGDMLAPSQKKYTLNYYLDLAKALENHGAHILCIKDMAGLLKPNAATVLIEALKKELSIPVHLHTHDTSSLQPATYLKAIEAGVDIIDVALGSMSGLTSQPNFNSIVAMMQNHERELKIDLHKLNEFSNYWENVREYYYPFESGLKAGTAEVFEHEIPGGQYSNLRPQARALGLEDKFEQIKENYVIVNKMFGDIVKVTPSSKVVGDMALFMTSNNYTEQDIFTKGHQMSFPDSVKQLFRGELGFPHGGFPEKLQKIILKDEEPLVGKPNAGLAEIDFENGFRAFLDKFPFGDFPDFLSWCFYPKVYEEFYNHVKKYGDVSVIPTQAFFYGLKTDQEIMVPLAKGKDVLVKYLHCSEPDAEGRRKVFFELNGQERIIYVIDRSVHTERKANVKVSAENHVGSPLQGKLSTILVKEGDEVPANSPLFVIEAMKMESSVISPVAGKISKIVLPEGSMVNQDDLVIIIEPKMAKAA